MTLRIKIFIVVSVLSLPFWWGINVLEEGLKDFFYWQEITENPHFLAAQTNQLILEQKLRNLEPFRNKNIPDLEIEAESATSVLTNSQGKEKILFEKEKDKVLPIASLTKLMTAKVVLENYELSQKIEITERAVKETGDSGNFKVGQIFSVKELLYPLLMESSNDAAVALAEVIGQKAFVDLMNLEAKKLGLNNTYFVNPTGLDPANPKDSPSYSTAQNLVKLTNHLLKEQSLIWEILSLSEFDFYTEDGIFHHKIINTNELLKEFPSIITGGKTGETPRAGGCLFLVTKAPKDRGYIINVILGSPDRFGEMRKLINWLNFAYKW